MTVSRDAACGRSCEVARVARATSNIRKCSPIEVTWQVDIRRREMQQTAGQLSVGTASSLTALVNWFHHLAPFAAQLLQQAFLQLFANRRAR